MVEVPDDWLERIALRFAASRMSPYPRDDEEKARPFIAAARMWVAHTLQKDVQELYPGVNEYGAYPGERDFRD